MGESSQPRIVPADSVAQKVKQEQPRQLVSGTSRPSAGSSKGRRDSADRDWARGCCFAPTSGAGIRGRAQLPAFWPLSTAASGHLDFLGVSGSTVSLSANAAFSTPAPPLLYSVGRSRHTPAQTQKSRERPTPPLRLLIEFGARVLEPATEAY